MRLVLTFCLCYAAQAAVVSRDWNAGKLEIKLDDGSAELEWLSSVAFRFARNWSDSVPLLSRLQHDKITPSFEDVGSTMTMRSKYITVALDRGDLGLRITSGGTPVTQTTLTRTAAGPELRFTMMPEERVFGLMGGPGAKLNVRGEKLDRQHGFFFTSVGYGIFVRSPASCVFDMKNGLVQASGADSMEYIFYYGPTAKEILEQFASFYPKPEVKPESLDLLAPDRLPKSAMKLPDTPVRSWDSLAALVRTILSWTLSDVTYPALDLSIFDGAPADVKQRAADFSTMFPVVYRSLGEGGIEMATRKAWTPYLITYLREAFDRGYPLIRPLPMQFSKDSNTDRQTDVFMIGDEVLLAPVVGPGARRRIELPRGIWTDLRTNAEYAGNRTVEVDAPPGRVPMLVRNGWIVPLAVEDKMELHYFPSLGAEFFLWEPDLGENSQFHAAPAGDFVRVEIETRRRRTYEWILHHTKSPREVAEDSGAYQKVERREQLRPGSWWHDAKLNNLHLMLRAEAEADRIVNISF